MVQLVESDIKTREVLDWKGVHVANPDIRRGAAIAGHRREPLRGIDAGAGRPAQTGQFERQAATARHVEEPVTVIDAEPVVNGHVFPCVKRLGQRREVGGPAAPPLVHDGPRRP